MKVLSIDPGLTGGLASINVSDTNISFEWAESMPTIKIETKPKQMIFDLDYSTSKAGKKQFIKSGPNKGQPKMKLKSPAKYKKELNTGYLFKLFKEHDIIVIEQQNPRPGNSAISSASTMKNYGKLLALAEIISGAELVTISPPKWNSSYHRTESRNQKQKLTPKEYKNMSIKKAYELSEWNTSYDGIADAICIGYYYIDNIMESL